ncbi:hypothetical protein Pelo_15663 [Pelomyxa schiedti]|nr:hypothetical protein Pelo_15663 [Pelomyxa schiedti]
MASSYDETAEGVTEDTHSVTRDEEEIQISGDFVRPKKEGARPPPEGGSAQYPEYFVVKGGLCTFNHLFDFAIHDGEIWYRKHLIPPLFRSAHNITSPHDSPSSSFFFPYPSSSSSSSSSASSSTLSDPGRTWRHIPFDAEEGEDPVALSADGANLMVLDTRHVIHYKKVCRETRRPKMGEYSFVDTCTAHNWVRQWFAFPILRLASLVVRPSKLKLPHDHLLWSCSHRGRFNEFWEDSSGRRHPEFSMVTTSYAVKPDGKDLVFADPYLPNHFGIRGGIVGPVHEPEFDIHCLDSSASCVCVVGRRPGGKDRLFVRYTDYDLLGKNPILFGFYRNGFTVDQTWVEHSLPRDVSNVSDVSVSQVGMGNAERLIVIRDATTSAIFSKKVFDAVWVMYIP